jgi:large subunit ribosomal protein L20
MARVKRGVTSHKRHKKILERAEGYWGQKSGVVNRAQEQLMKSGMYAYRDRRNRKRQFRQLWIVRLTAACHAHDMKYSELIHKLAVKGVALDRKVLSDMAIHDADAFTAVVGFVRA